MQARPRTKASRKRRVKMKKAPARQQDQDLGIPIGAKSNKATRLTKAVGDKSPFSGAGNCARMALEACPMAKQNQQGKDEDIRIICRNHRAAPNTRSSRASNAAWC